MSNNPYESPIQPDQTAKVSSGGFSIWQIVIALGIVFLLIAMLLPARRTAREAPRRNACINNMRQIGVALHNYEEVHGTLPPAYTVDDQGNRLHSWRTLILPYMEGQELFDSIDLSKPWDDPVNAKAREIAMPVYICPSAGHDDKLTTYMAVVGPGCTFSGSTGTKLSDVTDGTSKTIAVTEVGDDRAVHWMSPEDVGKDEFLELNSYSSHAGGAFHALFLDDHVMSMFPEDAREFLPALLTIAGGEEIPEL